MNDRTIPELDLSPARWLWLPGQRTLPNTQVVFRRALEVQGTVRQADGWIFADSRYLLKVNGQRVQTQRRKTGTMFLPSGDPEADRKAIREPASALYDPAGGIIVQFEFGPGAKIETALVVMDEWRQITD